MNFHLPTTMAGVRIQGDPNSQSWVTKFMVKFSNDGQRWTPYYQSFAVEPKMFDGNTDKDTMVSVFFDREITARYLRIVPQAWHGRIALRFEVLECPTPTGKSCEVKFKFTRQQLPFLLHVQESSRRGCSVKIEFLVI